MNSRNVLSIMLGGAVLAASAGLAAETQKDNAKAPQMTAEQKAEMEMWMKLATPGPEHKALDPLAGKFTAKVTMWQTPGGPAQVSSGSAERAWVLGGRYLHETFSGEMNGMPFHGIGYTGYDNYKKLYVSTWIDSMSTMVMASTGMRNNDGTFGFSATMPDPMSGKEATVREVIRVVDKDHQTFEMYGPDKTGKEFKMMEIAYSRKP